MEIKWLRAYVSGVEGGLYPEIVDGCAVLNAIREQADVHGFLLVKANCCCAYVPHGIDSTNVESSISAYVDLICPVPDRPCKTVQLGEHRSAQRLGHLRYTSDETYTSVSIREDGLDERRTPSSNGVTEKLSALCLQDVDSVIKLKDIGHHRHRLGTPSIVAGVETRTNCAYSLQ
jgi:hypothetical protein